VEGAVDKAV